MMYVCAQVHVLHAIVHKWRSEGSMHFIKWVQASAKLSLAASTFTH